MKIGFVGLGKMGLPMAERLVRAGHHVVAYNRSPQAIERAMAGGAHGAKDLSDVVAQLESPAIVWLMIPAGAVDAELEQLLPLLKPGDIVIDGGNSDFRLTTKRSELARSKKVEMVDVGTSGGILGADRGYCMMIGGQDEVVKKLEPIFEALGQPKGWRHVGPNGAGHYVKMVHNAVEYGMMESYSEGYRMLKEGPFDAIDLAEVADVWQHGSIVSSLLNQLTGEALSENPTLEGIDGYVAESGEARWTLEEAERRRIALPAIKAAFDVRLASQSGQTNFSTKLLAAMRNKFGGHNLNK